MSGKTDRCTNRQTKYNTLQVIRWAMHKLGVEEWLVSAVMSMYTDATTVVRTVYGNSNGFEVKVSMLQGSSLSPSLFVIVMGALSREFRVALPWELLYADDMVVTAETEDNVIKRFKEWKDNVENRGMRVNMNKTKVIPLRAVTDAAAAANDNDNNDNAGHHSTITRATYHQ